MSVVILRLTSDEELIIKRLRRKYRIPSRVQLVRLALEASPEWAGLGDSADSAEVD